MVPSLRDLCSLQLLTIYQPSFYAKFARFLLSSSDRWGGENYQLLLLVWYPSNSELNCQLRIECKPHPIDLPTFSSPRAWPRISRLAEIDEQPLCSAFSSSRPPSVTASVQAIIPPPCNLPSSLIELLPVCNESPVGLVPHLRDLSWRPDCTSFLNQ